VPVYFLERDHVGVATPGHAGDPLDVDDAVSALGMADIEREYADR